MVGNRSSLDEHCDALGRGVLLISECSTCRRPEFPPRERCAYCGDTRPPTWVESSGTGRLWSFAVFHKKYLDDFHLPMPYVAAVIALDEGVRVYANIVGAHVTGLQIDSPVRSRFITDVSGVKHLTFTPCEKEGS